jgi:acetolactate synthase I/II/III large subunit
MPSDRRTAATILVDALRVNGVHRVWCVPGESYLAVLDALYANPAIATITCRHESGAAYMAEAEGKLTGRPGIALVTRGPGASNAAIAVHTAAQDSTPMIMFVGGIARRMRGREAFQEFDVAAVFGSVARWCTTIDDAARIPEIIHRAFAEALSGRGGPVVIGIPEDMLNDTPGDVVDAPAFTPFRTVPGDDEVERVRDALIAAERPLLVIGGSKWDEASRTNAERIAALYGVPVASAFRRQDHFDNHDPHYAGYLGVGSEPTLFAAVRDADLIVAVGTRLGDPVTNGYDVLRVPAPKQRLVHVHPDHRELGKVYAPAIAVHAGAQEFVAALAAKTGPPSNASRAPWLERVASARAEALAGNGLHAREGYVDLDETFKRLDEVLPDDTIITNGAGNFTTWPQRYRRFRHFPSQLAPLSGAMGYGVPAAVAAAIVAPERLTVGIAGDGDFLMTGNELATAMRYDAAPIILVVNNDMYGTIRMHQEREYPGRVSGTRLTNPDFVAYGAAFGAYAEKVTRTEDVLPAFERARAAGRLALLELRTDPLRISPRASLKAE